ncbi:hypothetical protein PSN01_01586 [Micromonospora saelicesensis]|nr:hypothetical protein PSN01_01586 [Micromonospora saelicesensis]
MGGCGVPSSAARSNCSAASASIRSAGSLRSRPASTGASGPARRAAGGGSVTSAVRLIRLDGRAYGDCPSMAAYRVAPSDQRSPSGPTVPRMARSGDTYAGEPSTTPLRVRFTSSTAVARPKSVSTIRSSVPTRMLAGLTSRCMIPARWAARSAPSTASPISAARTGGTGPSVVMVSCSERDGTYSITICGSPSAFNSTSKTRTTLTWSSWAIARASRSDRTRNSCRASVVRLGGGTISLMATSRCNIRSRTFHTRPIPPWPRSSTTSYRSVTRSGGICDTRRGYLARRANNFRQRGRPLSGDPSAPATTGTILRRAP